MHRTEPDETTDHRDRRPWFALAIFAVALLVRFFHVWQIRRSPFYATLLGDSRGYDEWARQIAAGDWLGHEVFYQAPLYPYLLGFIYAIAGHHLLVVRVVQALIGSASCALLALAGARLMSRPAGIAAGLMLALYAPAIFFDGLLQKSVLDVFFVCLALSDHDQKEPRRPLRALRIRSVSLRSLRSRRFLLYVALGLTMGGLTLTRENALVFILVILGWITAKGLGARGWGPAVRSAGLFLAGLAIVLLPVAARNSYVGGGFFVTTSQFGPNFYIGNNAAADGTYQSLRFGRGSPEYERQDATEIAERALGTRLTPGQVSSYWTDKALDFVVSKPGAWLALMGRKVILLWNVTEMVDTESQEAHAEWSLPLRLGGFIGHFGILVPLALLGVFVTWPMRSRLWILYAMTLAYAASVVVFYVFARYRYPLVPLLMLFAAGGVVAIPALIASRRLPGGVWALAAVTAAAVACNWPMLSPALMRAVTETIWAARCRPTDGWTKRSIIHRAIASRRFPPAATRVRAARERQVADAISTTIRPLRASPVSRGGIQFANALLDAGKTGRGHRAFSDRAADDPGVGRRPQQSRIALMDQGRRDEAIAEFRAALAVEPDSAQSHLNPLTRSAPRTYAEAIEHFHRASQLNPADASSHYDPRQHAAGDGSLDDAIAEFRAALKIDEVGPHAEQPRHRARLQGRMEEAIAQFQQAPVVQPDFEEAKQPAVARQVRKGLGAGLALDARSQRRCRGGPACPPGPRAWARPLRTLDGTTARTAAGCRRGCAAASRR